PRRRARVAEAPPADEGLGRVVDASGVRRSARAMANEAREHAALMAQVPDPGAIHFGQDMSAPVASAQQDYLHGRRSDANEREDLRASITGSARHSADLSQLLPGAMRQHVEQHWSNPTTVSQADGRVNPEGGGAYAGAMFTSSFARGRGPAAAGDERKQTAEPRSPRPAAADGPSHRTHASPYAMVGSESNDVRTVWARQGGNLIVDTHIERQAQQSRDRGDHMTMLLRADTHDRSSVGVLSQPVASGPFTLHAAQYQRRPTASGAAPTGPVPPAAPATPPAGGSAGGTVGGPASHAASGPSGGGHGG
ncbi:hypothetical protein, partial [Chitiniphilus eburneus]